jgi:hypothetical protein
MANDSDGQDGWDGAERVSHFVAGLQSGPSQVNTLCSTHSPSLELAECECQDLSSGDYSTSYAMFNYVVVIYSLPIMAVFGLIGNVLNVFIYSRPKYVPSHF